MLLANSCDDTLMARNGKESAIFSRSQELLAVWISIITAAACQQLTSSSMRSIILGGEQPSGRLRTDLPFIWADAKAKSKAAKGEPAYLRVEILMR